MTSTRVRVKVRTTPIEWARKNLFRTPVDAFVTVVAGVLVAYGLYRFGRFVFVTGRWDVVKDNLTLFIVGGYDRNELWRPALSLIVLTGIGGVFAGALRRRQLEAGTADEDLAPVSRLIDLAKRLWPAILGVLLMLFMAETITPWLVVAGALASGVAMRLIGVRLPTRALGPLMVSSFAVAVAMVWVLLQPVGWDDWGGLMLNVFLAAISIVLCFPLGILLALGRRSKLPLIRIVSTAYIEIFRGVPLIALLLMSNVALGFFVPENVSVLGLFDIDLVPGKVVRALVVFTMFTAAYVAEIVRGGLQSVPTGQIEAGRALGMSPFHVTSMIVLPQALRNVIPALVGQFISLFKDTTLAGAAMGFLELLSVAQAATKQPGFNGQGLIAETLVFVSFMFWVGSFTMSRESQRLEQKLGVGSR
jgi:general L-amino acid transport system permease protein